MRKIKVEVTRDDVRRGRIRRVSFCPIALAVKRTIGVDEYSDRVSVDRYYAWFEKPTKKKRILKFELPAIAYDFVVDFDEGIIDVSNFVPFTFTAKVYSHATI